MKSSNKLPRVFVGTMHCGEGDFERCKEMIGAQVGVFVEHQVISGLTEREAHNSLWDAWRQRQKHFDMFAKVDADTVLRNEAILREFYELFQSNQNITSIQAPLHDYMTDDMINGLNCFDPRVQFRDTTDELYCDRVDMGHIIQLFAQDCPASLKPAGFHCHHATQIQAFHYGVHRGMKNQYTTLARIKKAYDRHTLAEDDKNNVLRLYAIRGFEMSKEFIPTRTFNYADQQLLEAFELAVREIDK